METSQAASFSHGSTPLTRQNAPPPRAAAIAPGFYSPSAKQSANPLFHGSGRMVADSKPQKVEAMGSSIGMFFGKTFAFIKAGGKPQGTRVCLKGDDSLTVAAPAPYSAKFLPTSLEKPMSSEVLNCN